MQCVRKTGSKRLKPLPDGPHRVDSRQFALPRGDQVKGQCCGIMGQGKPLWGDSQAVLGKGQAEPREALRRGNATSERFPVCWHTGSSCRSLGAADGVITQTSCSLPLHFLKQQLQRQCFSTGFGGVLPAWLSGWFVCVFVCVCTVTQSGPRASARGDSIMEIVWWPSGGTGSHSKLALEYFELAVMKANGNLACLQA